MKEIKLKERENKRNEQFLLKLLIFCSLKLKNKIIFFIVLVYYLNYILVYYFM